MDPQPPQHVQCRRHRRRAERPLPRPVAEEERNRRPCVRTRRLCRNTRTGLQNHVGRARDSRPGSLPDSIKGPKPVPATPGRPVDTASNSFVWSRGSGVFWQAVHACRGHGPRGDGPLCGWHVRGCNGSGRRGRGRLAGPAVAPAECSAGLARVQCDLWKDESQHNRSSTSSWEARDEWCPGDWIARQDVLFHDDGIPGAAP